MRSPHRLPPGRPVFRGRLIVLPWQLAESYPNAWCTAVVDHAGEPKPAYHAVRRAFLPERVTARVARIAQAGGAASVEAWVWSAVGRGAGGRVRAALLDQDGTLIHDRTWRLDGPVSEPVCAGRLEVDPAQWADRGSPVCSGSWSGRTATVPSSTGSASR